MEYGVVLRWWLLYQVLLVVGLPFTSRLLPDAPDNGAALAMPTALILLTIPTLWVGQLAFGFWPVLVVALALLAASAWLARGGIEVDARASAEVVGVFTVAFALLVAIQAAGRGVYPGGGEKFLDYGLLKSLLRANQLPPQDFWFAGERVVYYYGGHLMSSILALLSGTEGRYAYSPALAGFYAMAVTAAYGLASTIAARSIEDAEPFDGSPLLQLRGAVFVLAMLAFGVAWYLVVPAVVFATLVVTRSTRVRAGLLAAFVYGFASNLATPIRLLAGKVEFVRDLVVAAAIRPKFSPTVTPETFSYWPPSRIVQGAINEFPLFAYFNGDLHAHMMSVGVLFVVVGITLAYYRTPADRRIRRAGLLFVALPVPVGTILTVNTWSFPTALGVAALGVALADSEPRTVLPAAASERLARSTAAAREVQRVVLAVLAAAVVGVLGLAVVWPFVWNILLYGAGNRSVEFLPQTTRFGAFVLIHGLFLTTFAGYLVTRGARDARDWVVAALGAVGFASLAATFDLVVAGVRLDTVAVMLVGPLLVGAWVLRRRTHVGFEGVLVVAGAGLVVLVEYVFLAAGASPGRFNTVFKVYAQVWALWTVAAGVGLAALARRSTSSGRLAQVRSAGGTLFVVLLVVSTSLYGGLALSGHFDRMEDPSLDTMEYAHEEFPEQAAAIEWLDDRAGQPHIVSAPGDGRGDGNDHPYTWVNPASSLTGIPTVAGWVHAANYHNEPDYRMRTRDVEIIYTTDGAPSRAALLRKHDVEYIWVGPIERQRWQIAELVDEPGITTAYENPGVTIYAVNQTRLTERRA
jgi:YYY domain-containing protein